MPLGVDRIEVIEVHRGRRPGVNPSLDWSCALCGRSMAAGYLSTVTVRLPGDELEVRDIAVCASCLEDVADST